MSDLFSEQNDRIETIVFEIREGYYRIPGPNNKKIDVRVMRTREGIAFYYDTSLAANYFADSRTISVYLAEFQSVLKLLFTGQDQRKAALQFGHDYWKCCICGKSLELPRSRHYGIGPECEQKYPDIITQVDEEYGSSWEELNSS